MSRRYSEIDRPFNPTNHHNSILFSTKDLEHGNYHPDNFDRPILTSTLKFRSHIPLVRSGTAVRRYMRDTLDSVSLSE